MSLFGAIGDIHGDFGAATRVIERHPEVPFWLCVGDVADDEGRYLDLPAPLYWIKGNNDNFDVIASGEFPPNLHYIPNGRAITIDGLTVAGLGGTFAPTMYEVAAADLPHPKKSTPRATELADRRRHFVREEVEACKRLQGVDVFMSHEAPHPFKVNRGIQAGKVQVNEVIAAMRPRLHLFGHHHRYAPSTVLGVPSVGLDLVSNSYLLIDRNTLIYQHLPS
jgi:uncharacterized protein